MIVEVIAVGTELLLGEIINTNVADIGKRLAEDGFDVHHQVTVGDNLDRLVETIRTACERADAVVMTGGIGPTQDDQTRDAICALLGVDVTTDSGHAEAIRARLAERGIIADTALKMADYPEGREGSEAFTRDLMATIHELGLRSAERIGDAAGVRASA